ncbi:MAG: hypothetical protein M3142_04005, partial [Bacteroidota bacterium]|nr:hypothetical protein [Bacteroidota bacterium]
LYVAIRSFTAEMFAIFLSHLNKQCFAYFLEQLQLYLQQKGINKALFLGDEATAQTNQNWLAYKVLHW